MRWFVCIWFFFKVVEGLEYDFVIVGGGSAGCVVASRLSENPNWEVLLLEAGGDENYITDIPLAGFIYGSLLNNWKYKTEKSTTSCLGESDGRCKIAKGKALGGSSVINLMAYTRGNKQDYNEWESNGNPTWGYNHVLKYFKKSEKIGAKGYIDEEYHGTDGYLNVEYDRYHPELLPPFLEAGQELGYNQTDPNGKEQVGFARYQATMRNGKRCSAAKAFIKPAKTRKNLHIIKNAYVTKILIDNKTATGVEFVKNHLTFRVNPKKEVVLSAGSINSPQLLILSGLGPKHHLDTLNIPVVQPLQVGYNLQDHVSFYGMTFLVNQSVTITAKTGLNIKNVFDGLFHNTGPFTSPGGFEALAFLKSTNTISAPDIEVFLNVVGINQNTGSVIRKILGVNEKMYQEVLAPVQDIPGFQLIPVVITPKSRGRVMLKNTNPFEHPLIHANYYQHPDDVKTMIRAIRMAISIGESEAFRKYGTTYNRRPYPGCESLEWGSDTYWECCIRRYTNSVYHQAGTCKMGPSSDPDAVVDPQLKVYGIDNLRVIDASIMPTLIRGHPNAAIYMIAEKGSDMIKQYWNST